MGSVEGFSTLMVERGGVSDLCGKASLVIGKWIEDDVKLGAEWRAPLRLVDKRR